MGRLGTPADVGNAVVLRCSEEANWIPDSAALVHAAKLGVASSVTRVRRFRYRRFAPSFCVHSRALLELRTSMSLMVILGFRRPDKMIRERAESPAGSQNESAPSIYRPPATAASSRLGGSGDRSFRASRKNPGNSGKRSKSSTENSYGVIVQVNPPST